MIITALLSIFVFVLLVVISPVHIGIREFKCQQLPEEDFKILHRNETKRIFWIYFFMAFFILPIPLILTSWGGSEYYEEIKRCSGWYRAFSLKHMPSLLVYYILYFSSVIIVFTKGRNLPPLALSLCIVFICIGIVLNMLSTAQFLKTGRIWPDVSNISASSYMLNTIFSVCLLIKIIKQESDNALDREYENRFLNKINAIIGARCFLWAFILLIPVFVIITLILLLFGQEKDSLIKIWTETTEWRFSQKEHPPFLYSGGHYLCTVAACGHPCIVKPMRLGTRNGKTIIVNRQLMIANAYEDMLKRRLGKTHKAIRFIYDRYGYSVSKFITNKYASDIVYILMKPFEYFFLINLYLFELKPEHRINEQYEFLSD